MKALSLLAILLLSAVGFCQLQPIERLWFVGSAGNPTNGAEYVFYSTSGKYLAHRVSGTIHVFDADTFDLASTFKFSYAHSPRVKFAGDSRVLISNSDYAVYAHDLETGESRLVETFPSRISWCVPERQGTRVAVTTLVETKILDYVTGDVVGTIPLTQEPVWSYDGQRVYFEGPIVYRPDGTHVRNTKPGSGLSLKVSSTGQFFQYDRTNKAVNAYGYNGALLWTSPLIYSTIFTRGVVTNDGAGLLVASGKAVQLYGLEPNFPLIKEFQYSEDAQVHGLSVRPNYSQFATGMEVIEAGSVARSVRVNQHVLDDEWNEQRIDLVAGDYRNVSGYRRVLDDYLGAGPALVIGTTLATFRNARTGEILGSTDFYGHPSHKFFSKDGQFVQRAELDPITGIRSDYETTRRISTGATVAQGLSLRDIVRNGRAVTETELYEIREARTKFLGKIGPGAVMSPNGRYGANATTSETIEFYDGQQSLLLGSIPKPTRLYRYWVTEQNLLAVHYRDPSIYDTYHRVALYKFVNGEAILIRRFTQFNAAGVNSDFAGPRFAQTSPDGQWVVLGTCGVDYEPEDSRVRNRVMFCRMADGKVVREETSNAFEGGISWMEFTPDSEVMVMEHGEYLISGVRAPAVLTSFSVSATDVQMGGNLTGTVTISVPAGSQGVEVVLNSSRPLLSVPTTVTVQPGETSATFTLNAGTGPVPRVALVTANLEGLILKRKISVNP